MRCLNHKVFLRLVLVLATSSLCPGQRVAAVDGFHNNEKEPHYRWEGTYPGGYSQLGGILRELGFRTETLREAITPKTLAGTDMLIIADPDIPAEAEHPQYISAAESRALERWVRRGGILVLFGNDPGNAEFKHLNELARLFGVEFVESVHKDARGSVKLSIPGSGTHPVFAGGLTFYAVQVAPLKVTSKSAEILLADNGSPLMALVTHGKGRVLALGDPWIYNEYIQTRDNYQIARNLFRYISRQ